MTYNPDIHHRRSIRLREYDYSSGGAYFVTMCVQGREHLFGTVADGVMHLNDAGRMVAGTWRALAERFPNVTTDECIVMPNHVHGIIVIHEDRAIETVGAIHELPLDQQRRTMLIPKLIGYFKMNTAKQINIMRRNSGVPVWQRNYYERVIRDEEELAGIREYIRCNPLNWANDEENHM
ncbi:transposase [Geotalea uraniireducens]|nr:transposase [Geotalea uraniireducens]